MGWATGLSETSFRVRGQYCRTMWIRPFNYFLFFFLINLFCSIRKCYNLWSISWVIIRWIPPNIPLMPQVKVSQIYVYRSLKVCKKKFNTYETDTLWQPHRIICSTSYLLQNNQILPQKLVIGYKYIFVWIVWFSFNTLFNRYLDFLFCVYLPINS